jgi:hypothetical protein
VSLLTNVSSSFPDPNGWTAVVNNRTASPITFEVDAACAKQPRNYAIVEGPFVQNPAGLQNRALVTCPKGSKPLSGGVSATSDSPLVSTNTSVPLGRSWEAFENNTSPDANAVSAFAVCAKIPGYTVVQGTLVTNPANSHTPSFATCPDPTVVIGGGADSNAPSLFVNVSGTGMAGTEFDSFMNNASGVDFLSSSVAICAGS